jgi:hypothetical protein
MVALAVALLLAGCAGISPQAKRLLAEPSSCIAPQTDIGLLEHSRRGGGLRFLQAMHGILPPVALVSLVRSLLGMPPGMYADHWRVATGRYNTKIDARIIEIRRVCAK